MMNTHVQKRIQILCKDLYGDPEVEVRPIPLKWAEGYYLTERGDMFIFRGKNPLGRVSKAKNDTVQFYQNGKRVFWMVRRKLMLITFKNMTLGMVEKINVFPLNGKTHDLKIENLQAFESYSEGRRKCYKDDFQKSNCLLDTRQILEIRRAKGKRNRRYLANKYNVSMRTITRVWNNQTYQHEKIL